MTISEAIDALSRAGKAIGYDSDLVYVADSQFCNILAIDGARKPTPETEWVWSKPVAIITLETE